MIIILIKSTIFPITHEFIIVVHPGIGDGWLRCFQVPEFHLSNNLSLITNGNMKKTPFHFSPPNHSLNAADRSVLTTVSASVGGFNFTLTRDFENANISSME